MEAHVERAQTAHMLPKLDWQKLFLFATALLASTILLKVAGVQYLEIIYLGLLATLVLRFMERGGKATWFRPFSRIALLYLAFIIGSFALALAALRYDFYLPITPDPLKGPIVITILRIVELVASVGAMFYMAHLFRLDEVKAGFTMRVYFWTGVASAVYGILSLPLDLLGIASLGAYGDQHRLRGFYNEGGPYGLYLISIMLVGIALIRLTWAGTIARFAIGIVAVAFLLTYSKAAFCAVVVLFAFNALMASSVTRRLVILGSGLAALVILLQFVDVANGLRIYRKGAEGYERLSHAHPDDTNFVYGRIAGAFLVPRMIAEHPLTGIGWGNYGNLRNAPEYRGAALFVQNADDPGLGLLGATAELGLPLIALLLVCLTMPFFYLRRLGAPTYLTNLALIQPLVHLFGAQLNLTYPWVVTSFALGVGFGMTRPRGNTLIPLTQLPGENELS